MKLGRCAIVTAAEMSKAIVTTIDHGMAGYSHWRWTTLYSPPLRWGCRTAAPVDDADVVREERGAGLGHTVDFYLAREGGKNGDFHQGRNRMIKRRLLGVSAGLALATAGLPVLGLD